MQKPIPEKEISQIEIALEHGRGTRPFNGVIALFWGLIFTKLFLLEYGVQVYQVPINSMLFVWTLTLVMGVVCSAAYIKMVLKKKLTRPMTNRVTSAIWAAAFVSTGVIAFAAISLGRLDPYFMPAVCALALAVGYFLHGTLVRFPVFQILGGCWLLVGIGLAAVSGPVSMAGFALAMVLFVVLPTAVLHFSPQNRRRIAEADA